MKNNMINGAISGGLTSILCHPLDVIKIHQQENRRIITEFKNMGPKLFYRGYSKGLSKQVINSTILFPTYDFYKYYFHNHFIASALSAFTIVTILHPLDYFNVRHIANGKINYKNILGYYRGYHINLMRIIPHFCITMVVIEFLNRKLIH